MNRKPRLDYPRQAVRLAGVLLLCSVLACNLSGGSQATDTPPPSLAEAVVRLSEIRNVVEASASPGAAFAAATDGQTVAAGGAVHTGEGGRVRLDASDASIVRLDAGTQLLLEQLPGGGAPATRLMLNIGQLWALVSDRPDGGAFEIATPESVVSAERGSLVNVSYYPDSGRVVITCLQGQCRLASASGEGTDLSGGQQAEISAPGQSPSGPSPMDGLQLGAWAGEFPEAEPVASQITPGAPGGQAAPVADLSGGGNIYQARLAFDGQGILHLVWRSDRLRASGDFFHQQLSPGGEWSEVETLTDGFEYLDVGPQLLVKGGNLCVLWTGGPAVNDSSGWGLFQKCQAAGSWSQAERLDPQTGEFSAAAAPDGSLQVLWFVRLTGVHFGAATLSSEVATVLPKLVIDSAGVYHAVWINLGTPYTVTHRSSQDGGQNWTPEETVSADDSAPSGLELSVVADGAGNIHVAWPGTGLYYRRWSPDTGWGELEHLLGSGGWLGIATNPSGRAWIVWAGGGQAYYDRQGEDGKFSAPVPIGKLGSDKPTVAIDAQGKAHIVWVEGTELWYTSLGP